MKLNGKETPLNEPVSLKKFVEERGYKPSRIASELNGRIIPKADYEKTIVSDSDVLEIVTFVGGG